jgi:5-methylcytosine-specific restriction endonuclease McrA
LPQLAAMMFDIKTRVALWNANQRKCFYCSEPISYKDLEIDHIVPEKTTTHELVELQSRISLPSDFGLNALCNLGPTHHSCNNRKGGTLLDDQVIVYYQQLWSKKQEPIQRELEKHVKAAARDRHLIAISRLIELGEITKQEIWQVISKIQTPSKPTPQDPLVVAFSTNPGALLASGALPKSAGDTYVTACDWLEEDLLFSVSSLLPTLAEQTEASARNGETLSVRIAFGNFDLDQLDRLDHPNWDIFEIANFSELYDVSPDTFLVKAVVKASGNVVADPWDTAFGIGRCPRCGSDKLKRFSTTDHYHDETYHTIECEQCDWSEWTQ